MPRIVLAAALLLLSAGVADDDFKTCASGAPDYAIMACTNLIEGGKLDARDQSVAYTNRAVAFRKRGTLAALGRRNEAIAEYTKALAIKPDLTRELAGPGRPATRRSFNGAGKTLGRLGLHQPCGVAERSRHKLEGKQPCRIHGARQPDLTWRNRHEAEPAVIGHVPYEHDEAKALRARTR